jgi:hypothetical protein
VSLARALGAAFDDPSAARTRSIAARNRLIEAYAVEPWLDHYDRVYAGLGSGDRPVPRVGSA